MAEELERHVLHCDREQQTVEQLPACRFVVGETSPTLTMSALSSFFRAY
jgi:hypothetical protein